MKKPTNPFDGLSSLFKAVTADQVREVFRAAEAEADVSRRAVGEIEWAIHQLVASAGSQAMEARGKLGVEVNLRNFSLGDGGEAFELALSIRASRSGWVDIRGVAGPLELPVDLLELSWEEAKGAALVRLTAFFDLIDAEEKRKLEKKRRELDELSVIVGLPTGAFRFEDGPLSPPGPDDEGACAVVELKAGGFEIATVYDDLVWSIPCGREAVTLSLRAVKAFARLPPRGSF